MRSRERGSAHDCKEKPSRVHTFSHHVSGSVALRSAMPIDRNITTRVLLDPLYRRLAL